MMSFQRYLSEQTIAWLASASEHIFSEYPQIALTSRQSASILGGRLPRKRVYHAADLNSLKTMKTLQGKKKSISVFTDTTDADLVSDGIWAGGGVVYQLDADVLVAGPGDIMSRPDKSGRRWVELEMLGKYTEEEDRIARADLDDIELDGKKVLLRLYKRYTGKNASGSNIQDQWMFTDPRRIQNPDKYYAQPADLKITFKKRTYGKGMSNKVRILLLAHMVKDYLDMMAGLVKKHRVKLKEIFFRSALSNVASRRLNPGAYYNELVANNIKIEKLLLLKNKAYLWAENELDNDYAFSGDETRDEKEEMIGKHLKDFLSQHNVSYELFNSPGTLMSYIENQSDNLRIQ